MLRETRKNALKNSGFEVRVLVDLVENDGGFVLGPYGGNKSRQRGATLKVQGYVNKSSKYKSY